MRGEFRAKGYYLEDFGEMFKRYLPKSEVMKLMEEVVKVGI